MTVRVVPGNKTGPVGMQMDKDKIKAVIYFITCLRQAYVTYNYVSYVQICNSDVPLQCINVKCEYYRCGIFCIFIKQYF